MISDFTIARDNVRAAAIEVRNRAEAIYVGASPARSKHPVDWSCAEQQAMNAWAQAKERRTNLRSLASRLERAADEMDRFDQGATR